MEKRNEATNREIRNNLTLKRWTCFRVYALSSDHNVLSARDTIAHSWRLLFRAMSSDVKCSLQNVLLLSPRVSKSRTWIIHIATIHGMQTLFFLSFSRLIFIKFSRYKKNYRPFLLSSFCSEPKQQRQWRSQ